MVTNLRNNSVRALSSALALVIFTNSAHAALKQYWTFEDATTSTTLANQVAGGNVGTIYEKDVVATAPATFYSNSVPAAIASHSNQSLFLGGTRYPQFPAFFSNSGWANLGSFDLDNELTLSGWFKVGPSAFGHEVDHRPWSQVTTIGQPFGGNANLLDLNHPYLLDNTSTWQKLSDTNVFSQAAPQWRHWGLAFSPAGGGTASFYLDGALQYTVPGQFNFEPGQSEFGLGLAYYLGGAGGGVFDPSATELGAYLRGNIDDLAIFDEALSGAQIARLAAGVNPALVPEPATLTLLAMSACLLLNRRVRA